MTGTVVDNITGEPLIGVSITVVGKNLGTVTDIDGNFSIKVSETNSSLNFSYIGYESQTIQVRNQTKLTVALEESLQMLEEVQVVAYGSQKKVSVTGAISSVKGDELLKTPTGSLSNALSGLVSGVSSVQYSGEPGADDAEIYIRGITTLNSSAPLIQVDGVEREFSQLDPNEIESITVLKDASATAVFGVRGANGVILITTKRGVQGKAKISVSTSAGVQVPSRLLKFANSYQYASFYNEAQANDGASPAEYKFQPEVLEAFRTGSDPLLYPDTDWQDMLLKGGAFQSQHNINITGGVDNIRYFVSVGAFTQEGLFKTFETGYNFNFNYNRYNYRANIDFDITKTTLLQVNLGGRMESKNTPISDEDGNQLFRKLYWATPFSGAGIVDGKWIKTNADYIPNPGSDGLDSFYGQGYNNKTTNVLNLDFVLDQKLDMLTKGLSVKLKGSYNSSYGHIKRGSSSTPYYTPVLTSNGEVELKKSGDDSQVNYSTSYEKGRDWYAEASLNYNRKFEEHSVGALVLYNQSKTYYPRQYTDIPSGYVGLVGRVTYDWKTRYMAEFNIGYNGSENFAPGKRYGIFPAGSVGWVVSEESFMQDIKYYLNYLKVRASFGVVGNDKYYVSNIQQRFLYIPDSYVLNSGGYNFGTNNGSNQSGAYESAKSNQDVTWEKAYKQNYGIDMAFFQERLKVTADYFREHRVDILVKPLTYPGILGMSMPVVNMGIVDSQGYELSLRWDDKLRNGFRYWVAGNLSYAKNEVKESGEVPPNEEYMWQKGNPVGSYFVRKFWGFYDETADARYEAEFGQPIAEHAGGLEYGDCVYVDLNGDGVIDSDDIMKLGYTNVPQYIAGLNLGFEWKGFDLSMQWTGGWNVSRLLQETFREPMGDTHQKGLLLYQVEERWTPETAATAKLPRATIEHKTNNYANSDLFLVNSNYLRLKNIEIGYNFRIKPFKKAGIENCRLYLNGYNLLTISKFKLGDPESRTSDRPEYPLTRVFNVGLKLGF
ncbi:MAG: TonB-dependent receptor [Tannerellaceae bacterium]|nr:TonB-dependent receptor [Tannerellaceae bacterium]